MEEVLTPTERGACFKMLSYMYLVKINLRPGCWAEGGGGGVTSCPSTLSQDFFLLPLGIVFSIFFFPVPRLRFFSYFSSNVYMRAFVWL